MSKSCGAPTGESRAGALFTIKGRYTVTVKCILEIGLTDSLITPDECSMCAIFELNHEIMVSQSYR